jgi:16S rRNA (cytosine1402-N4)-methyltransferase
MMSLVVPKAGVMRLTRGDRISAQDIPETTGGGTPHIPVLRGKIAQWLAVRDGGIYIDGTFGAGGYTNEILAAANCKVIGIDRDQSAIAGGMGAVEAASGRLTLIQDRFSRLDAVAKECGSDRVDGVVLDIGVSSMQIDRAERGFSFRQDGPLDMRMGDEGPSAADLVAAVSLQDLTRIISRLGEEKFARPIAKAIVQARSTARIETTRNLSEIISGVVHARFGEIHPATRTFQALRIFVNEELFELAMALSAAERVLKPEGRLVVVTFHSLEDRIVKTFLNERGRLQTGSRHLPEIKSAMPSFEILTRRPVVPDETEIAANPRSRSAKLRAASRTAAPPRNFDIDSVLPDLPSLAEAMRGG